MALYFRKPGLYALGTVLCLALTVCGCSEQKESQETGERIYATVNDKHLTESMLRSLVPSEFYDKLTANYRKEIIREWVNKELMYQEALEREFEKDKRISLILDRSKRDLLTTELLERTLSEMPPPTDEILRKYYEENSDMFILQGDEFEIRYSLFDTMKDAQAFYSKVKKGASFSDLAKTESKDLSAKTGGILGTINEQSVEPSVWNETVSLHKRLGLRKISNPFSVIDGFSIVIIDKRYKMGSVWPFETVRYQVSDLYLIDVRESVKEKLLRQLTNNAEISYNF